MLRKRMEVKARQNGFTLIEVLVAMALFAIGMLAVAGMFMLQTRGNTFGGGMSIANQLAIQRLEEVMMTPTANLAVRFPAGGGEFVTPSGGACAAPTSPTCYRRFMTYDPNGPGGTTGVRVEVEWTDQIGAVHTISAATLKR